MAARTVIGHILDLFARAETASVRAVKMVDAPNKIDGRGQ
jgi:hypothetical protein